jgi:hypothetical protein
MGVASFHAVLCAVNITAIPKTDFLPMPYQAVHLNSRLDFSDAPVSKGLALTSLNYNFGEWPLIGE